jgi:endoglucanase
MVDVGLSGKRARELVSIGTPIGFAPYYTELLENRIAGKSFDDKACAACALWALINTPAEELAGDVYVLLSSVEETNRVGGVGAATFAISPDYAMVLDVNLARVPDTKNFETVEMGKGISISVSAATHMELTRDIQRLCEENNIPHCMVAAPQSTGTNAPSLNLTRDGVPVADVGLPLASMHTYNEVISLDDCETLCELVRAFVCCERIAEKMNFGEVRWI